MKVLVLGSSGFIGKKVKDILSADHDVYGASRAGNLATKDLTIDLTKKETIARVLKKVQPEAIVNCAGVVGKGEKAMLNPVFTSNLLEEVIASGLKPNRIVISGSAAEYGPVDKKDIPVKENTPLNATSDYGLSKLREETLALELGQKGRLPIIIARIFNPIGVGMNPHLLLPSLLQQIQEIQKGNRGSIEISRLDSKRDYVNIKDVALAIKAIVEGELNQSIYNIGSGRSTSNEELIEVILKNSKLVNRPEVIEASPGPEPLVAIQADISRIKNDLGWEPTSTLEETIKEIMYAAR